MRKTPDSPTAPLPEPQLQPQTLLAFGFLALGVACSAAGFGSSPGEQAHDLWIAAGHFAGIGLGFAAIGWQGRSDPVPDHPFRYRACALALALLLPCVIYWCGMRQFGGFDHSVLIDFGWRLVNGQRPYLDFPVTAPPGFVLGAYYAFRIFGVYWQSIVLIFALFSAVTFLWSVLLLGQLFESKRIGLLLAVALQALCLIPASYWWYNPVAAASGIIFALSASVFLRRPRTTAAAVSYFFALVLLGTTKPNVAALLIVPVTAILVTSREHRGRAMALSGLAFAFVFAWLQIEGLGLRDVIAGYAGVAGRGLVIGQFFTDAYKLEIGLSLAGLALMLAPLAGCVLRRRELMRDWRLAGIGLACTIAGLNSFLSAGETKIVDLGIVFFGVVLICSACGAAYGERRPGSTSSTTVIGAYLAFIAIAASSVGISIGLTRHRVLGIGYQAFFQYSMASDPFGEGFFRGLHSGTILKDTYAQIEGVLNKSPGKRAFFGPRMQWGYAAFGLPSPVGQPVWWHPGVSFPLPDQQRYLDDPFGTANEILIFFKNDFTYYRPEFVRQILLRYDLDQSYSYLTVFHLKP